MPGGLQAEARAGHAQALVPGQFDNAEEEEEWLRDIYNRPSDIERRKNSGGLESGNGNGNGDGGGRDILGKKRLLLEDVLLGVNDGLDSSTTTYSSMDSSTSASCGIDCSMDTSTCSIDEELHSCFAMEDYVPNLLEISAQIAKRHNTERLMDEVKRSFTHHLVGEGQSGWSALSLKIEDGVLRKLLQRDTLYHVFGRRMRRFADGEQINVKT